MRLLDCLTEQAGLYTLREASIYANIPIATLRYWFIGNQQHPPVRKTVVDDGGMTYITFQDFIEAVAIRYLRTHYSFSLPKIREAVLEAKEKYKVSYPFSDRRHGIGIDGKDFHLYLESAEDPYQLSGKYKGQKSLDKCIAQFIKHLSFDENGVAYEYIAADYGDTKITLNPKFMFGSPRVSKVPYSAITLWRAKKAEGEISKVARLYNVREEAVIASCKYCEEELHLAA